jgi:hypothetical protein
MRLCSRTQEVISSLMPMIQVASQLFRYLTQNALPLSQLNLMMRLLRLT